MTFDSSLKFVNKNAVDALLKKRERQRVRSGPKALKEVGREAVKSIKSQIRGGTVGGSKFEKLTNIGRFKILSGKKAGIKGPKRNKPLASLAKGVRMNAQKTGQKLILLIGFVGGTRASQGIVNLAKIFQEGQSVRISRKQRALFHRVGNALSESGKKKMAKFFHLPKSTTTLVTPARPIIDPWWEQNERAIKTKVQVRWARLVKI